MVCDASAMAEIRTVTTLRAKRDEIQARIADYERKIKQARADLAAIGAAIRIFEVTGETNEVSAYTDLHRLFKRGESLAIARKALAERGPLTTSEIAKVVMKAKGLDATDAVLRKQVALRLVHALLIQCKSGRLVSPGKAKGGVRIWALP